MNSTAHVRVVPAQRMVEGGGFVVHRPFPVPGLSFFDPFLLIDEMGPVDYGPGEAIGAPDHPHRGFETVTYMIDGAMDHEDSHGHKGSLRNGDVQWMTAGSGVIHSEMPSKELKERGGHMHGFQIWVNLPRELKMTRARYQEYTHDRLPVVSGDGRWIRVIAGEVDGVKSPIETTHPSTLLHVKLEPNIATTLNIAPGSNAIVHTISGGGVVEGNDLREHEDALLEGAPQTLHLAAGSKGFEALVLAGVPLHEPVARYGPFVMNTREEIQQAVADLQAGRFGEIAREN
ncbi:MAG TPA: pirin family protein [Candidatus Binatia bacterium]|nr:pirin family protein [Candidatus Binatia bacterium]